MTIFISILVPLLLSVGVAQAGEICVDDGLGGCKPLNMYVDKNIGLVIEPIENHGCYQKMQEVIRRMKARMHPNPNSRSLTRGFVMTDEDWAREFEPTYQECVK